MDPIPPQKDLILKIIVKSKEDPEVTGLLVETPKGTLEVDYNQNIGPVAKGHGWRGHVAVALGGGLMYLGILDERWYPADKYWWGGPGEGVLFFLGVVANAVLAGMVWLPPGLVHHGKKQDKEEG